MEAKKEFTVEEGIAVQDEQLDVWKNVLTPEAFINLVFYAKKDNHKANKVKYFTPQQVEEINKWKQKVVFIETVIQKLENK